MLLGEPEPQRGWRSARPGDRDGSEGRCGASRRPRLQSLHRWGSSSAAPRLRLSADTRRRVRPPWRAANVVKAPASRELSGALGRSTGPREAGAEVAPPRAPQQAQAGQWKGRPVGRHVYAPSGGVTRRLPTQTPCSRSIPAIAHPIYASTEAPRQSVPLGSPRRPRRRPQTLCLPCRAP